MALALQIKSIFAAQAPTDSTALQICPGCTMIALFDALVVLSVMENFSLGLCASQLAAVLADVPTTSPTSVYQLAERLR